MGRVPVTQELAASRWRRRAKTIPLMLGATAAATLATPVVVPVLAARDLLRGRVRLPGPRVYLFALRYAWNDSAEILLAGPYWLLAGFGRRLDAPASIARHERLQAWSLRTLARWGERLLGLRVELEAGDEALLLPGPAIVVSRHVSIVDASLPALLYLGRGASVRGVIMAELLADPGFDLLYGRLGSVFVPRDNAPEALALVAEVAGHLDARTVAAIFPEGRLYRPEVLARGIARLAERDPARAERLAGLRSVLPPRSGGFLALASGSPGADIVVLDHRGLEAFGRFADLARSVPLTEPIRVTARRYRRAELPASLDGLATWLDERWVELDAAVGDAMGW